MGIRSFPVKVNQRGVAPVPPLSDVSIPAAERLSLLHHECFACGVCNRNGLNLHFEVDQNGLAQAVWQPSAQYRSYPDRVHGGVIATLMDSAIVHALFARGVAGVTAELVIRYLHGVAIDAPVHVSGWVESCRHRVYFCQAEVRQGGVLVVRASARFMEMRLPAPGARS